MVHILMDIRFPPKVQIDINSGSKIKEVVNDIFLDFFRDFLCILNAPIVDSDFGISRSAFHS